MAVISKFRVDEDVAEAIAEAVAAMKLPPGVRTRDRATWLRIAIMNQLKADGIKIK